MNYEIRNRIKLKVAVISLQGIPKNEQRLMRNNQLTLDYGYSTLDYNTP